MTICDKCSKTITGQYVYNEDKKDEGKKFCTLYCMHEYYGFPCEECGKKSAHWVYSPDKKDDKKFCSNYCMQTHYRSQKKGEENSSSKFNWKDYQGWIIGGGIVLVLLIVIGLLFGKKKNQPNNYNS